MKKQILTFLLVFLLPAIAFAQATKTVKGTVVDKDNMPVIGATVRVVGTNIVTATDFDGNYVLSNVPEDATITYTYIGMSTQEVKVAGQSQINVTMAEDAQNLEEVVVIGYGSAKAKDLTAPIAVVKGDDIASLIGWTAAKDAVVSNGVNASGIKDTLNNSVNISNNFASFAFLSDISAQDLEAIGAFCDEQNNEYMYVFDVDSVNYSELIAVAGKHSGMCANYLDKTDEIPAYLMPATILAATNYDKVNGTVNYMYQQFAQQAVAVDDDELANKLDALKINYNGQTQKSGTKLEFYQDGYLADGTDIGVYANEIWLKDAMKTSVLNLLIALDKIPANTDGISLLEGSLQEVISEAKNNGTISVEKELTSEQKAYITQYTGDDVAWQTVYLNGYTLSVDLKQDNSNGKTMYVAEYALLYSKGDSIRKVEGAHTLI